MEIASPYIMIGSIIVLDDTVNNVQQELGRLINIDKDTFELTTVSPVSSNFPIGSIVRQYNYVFRNFLFSSQGLQKYGRKGFGTKEIPKNVQILVQVQNNDGAAKTIYVTMEYFRS